jgi:hypothetical protein
MPLQDEHLPDQIEFSVHQAGLELQRRLFQALIEKADRELVLQQRHGKADAGTQRKGTRPFTFKTIFGAVTVRRSRILQKHDGTIEIPSAVAWKTSHQSMITRNLRDAVCDQMGDQSARQSRAGLCESAGDDDLLGPSTIIDIVHQEGERLLAAQRERPGRPVGGVPGPVGSARPRRGGSRRVDRVSRWRPPFDDSEEARAEWEQVQAEWIATGFAGCEPAKPVDEGEPRAVDKGFVIVEPDEVKTKAQPSSGRKEVWTYTAVVLVAGLRHCLAEAAAEGLWL